MTLAQFDRLPEVYRVVHLADYDEWADEKAGRCPDCGRPLSECSDPLREWHVQRAICYPTRELAAAERRFKELHADDSGRVWHDGSETEWSGKSSKRTPYQYDDGVTLFVTDQPDLDDDFLRLYGPNENGGDLSGSSS